VAGADRGWEFGPTSWSRTIASWAARWRARPHSSGEGSCRCGGVGDELVGSAPHPLGRLPVGVLAEGCLQAGMDGVQVDAQGGQQLASLGMQ